MSREEAVAKAGKLMAVTVERGATPAEAATAALLAVSLISQVAHRSAAGPLAHGALAPGVHVTIV